jgi:hypothetical protein
MHRRKIVLDKASLGIAIEDTLQMEAAHAVELFLHCHEKCAVTVQKNRARLQRGDRSVEIRFPDVPGATLELLQGSTSPIGGWVSRAFDRKQPAPTLVWRATLTGRSVLRTEIAC